MLARKPYYNWDMFPYMAIALSDQSVPFSATHELVYSQAQSQMPAGDFKAVSERQILLKNDPQAFFAILKYFEIKPGYNLTVKLLHRLGLSVLSATYAPSIVGYFLIGCLMFWVVVKVVSPPVAFFLSLLTMTLSGLKNRDAIR